MDNKPKLDKMYSLVERWGNQPTAHHFVGEMYAKEMHLAAGDISCMHVHDYDHDSLYVGHVRVMTDDKETEYKGAGAIRIKAGVRHAILAVTDSIWICSHPADRAADEVAITRRAA